MSTWRVEADMLMRQYIDNYVEMVGDLIAQHEAAITPKEKDAIFMKCLSYSSQAVIVMTTWMTIK